MNEPNLRAEGPFIMHAPGYWSRGLSVVPLETAAKRPAKEILGWQGYMNGPPKSDKQQDWLTRFPDRGLGLLMGTEVEPGERLGAVDLDLDGFTRAVESVLVGAVQKRGKKGSTFFVRYRDDDGLKSTTLKGADERGAADVLLAGKMTVIPPSLHPDTGNPYSWIGPSLLEANLANSPVLNREKLEILRFILGSPHAKTLTTGETTHEAGLVLAAQLVRLGCSDEEVLNTIAALLPVGYSGNSLKELPGWI